MNREEFKGKLLAYKKCVNELDRIKGEIYDAYDYAENSELLECIMTMINGLMPNETGFAAYTVDEIMNAYDEIEMTEYNEEQFIKAMMKSSPDVIERFLGRKTVFKRNKDKLAAIKEAMIQMPEDEFRKFYDELCGGKSSAVCDETERERLYRLANLITEITGKDTPYDKALASENEPIAIYRAIHGLKNALKDIGFAFPEHNEEQSLMIAYDIDWDTDGEEADLPNEILLPNGITDVNEISDYISDTIGFCHKGFRIAKNLKERVKALSSLVAEGAALELDYDAAKDLWYVMNYYPGYAENIIGKDGKLITVFEHTPYEKVVSALDEMDVWYVGK